MAKMERKTNIKSTVEKVFKILDTPMDMPKWNLVVKEIEEIEPGKYFVKSTVGDLTAIRTETIPNERITEKQEGSILKELGYILKPKGDVVEATIWGKFDDPSQEPILGIAGEVFLKSLKKYAEYLESGGNPNEYKKK
ncbi:MAG: hypothetical protein ACTSRG_17265 [Candidatus Helarchaeota archaeon]